MHHKWYISRYFKTGIEANYVDRYLSETVGKGLCLCGVIFECVGIQNTADWEYVPECPIHGGDTKWDDLAKEYFNAI